MIRPIAWVHECQQGKEMRKDTPRYFEGGLTSHWAIGSAFNDNLTADMVFCPWCGWRLPEKPGEVPDAKP